MVTEEGVTSVPPVIVIGMHRAGTSMLTRTLQGLGFFMGRGTTRNEECRWMNALNYWVFAQASATWERPEGVDTLLAADDGYPVVADYLRGVTAGPASRGYLGWWRWCRYRSMHRQGRPWGWKDPRNTFSLPLWLDVFPGARVLHITRHGVDVAESLRLRRRKAVETSANRYWRQRALYVNNPLAPKRSGFIHSGRVASLDGGLALWSAYTARAQEHVRALGDRALELRYEDLLASPQEHLARITAFCGLEVGRDAIRELAARFNPDRAYAYARNQELAAFAQRRRDTLGSLGYGF